MTDWRDQAACLGIDPELFFPIGQGDTMLPARRACSLCPVVAECLEDALQAGDVYAFRGGTSGREREALLVARRKTPPARESDQKGVA